MRRGRPLDTHTPEVTAMARWRNPAPSTRPVLPSQESARARDLTGDHPLDVIPALGACARQAAVGRVREDDCAVASSTKFADVRRRVLHEEVGIDARFVGDETKIPVGDAMIVMAIASPTTRF